MDMAVLTRLTIEDFEKLPDALARNHELVNGELVDVSGNTLLHNKLKHRLTRLLEDYVNAHGLGDVTEEQEYRFGDDAHGPDISFLLPEKALHAIDKRVQPFVPDLAIEIASNNDGYYDLTGKAHKYLRFGTSEVWVVSLYEHEISRYTTSGGEIFYEDATLETPLIPGFSLRLRELFDQAALPFVR